MVGILLRQPDQRPPDSGSSEPASPMSLERRCVDDGGSRGDTLPYRWILVALVEFLDEKKSLALDIRKFVSEHLPPQSTCLGHVLSDVCAHVYLVVFVFGWFLLSTINSQFST